MSSYLPPKGIPTLAMIGKPVQIFAKTKEDVPANSFEIEMDRTWAGTLESFAHNRRQNILTFKFEGVQGKYELNLESVNVEVYDK